jgi:glycosyltransferase involved in cell wall biosynthesis
MHEPLVTVVTIVRNLVENKRIETFLQCVDSIHSQTYSRVEHLIIDGASTDGTTQFLEEYISKKNIRLISEPDSGVWDAMNKGAQLANGSIINFMNSDDWFNSSDAISNAVEGMRLNNAEWHYANAWIIRGDGSRYLFPTKEAGIYACGGIVHQTVFIGRDLLLAADPFNTPWITKENYLMMLLLRNRIPASFDPTPTVCYREGGFSTQEYLGLNAERTKKDFAIYFHKLAGQFWGMSLEECVELHSFQLFRTWNIFRVARLSFKIKDSGLRREIMRFPLRAAPRILHDITRRLLAKVFLVQK